MANPYKNPDTGQFLSKRKAKKQTPVAPPPTPPPTPPPDDESPRMVTLHMTQEEYDALVADQKKCDPRLPRALTPIGAVERVAALRAAGKPIADPNIQVTRDAHEKIYDARNDAIDGKLPEWEAPDPLADLQRKYGRPGHKLRVLSDPAVQRLGMERWTPVKDENGNVVRYGAQSFLAEAPAALVKAREKMYREKTHEEVVELAERAKGLLENAAVPGRMEPLQMGAVVRDANRDASRAMGVRISGGDSLEGSPPPAE